jgi:hypothetical protein
MPSSSTRLDTMDRDELIRLAGEQAILKRDLGALNAEQQRDLQALRNLPNDVAHSPDWYERGQQLLTRLRDRQLQLADGQRRAAELARLTGIN